MSQSSVFSDVSAAYPEENLYELFKAKGCLFVLCYLYTHGASSKYRIVRDLKFSKEAVSHAVDVLSSLGLCQAGRALLFPFATRVELTKQGTKLLSIRVFELPGFVFQHDGSTGRTAVPVFAQ